ncbi:MAG: hypothetical protein RR929_00350 [Erysipelotrichaceae bacterium]
MNGYKLATKLVTMLLFGILIAIYLGDKIDSYLNTTPWVMLAMIVYVIVGCLILLVKETNKNGE